MSALLLPIWLALGAFAALLAIRVVREARRDPHAIASRWVLVATALGAALLAGSAAAILGVAPAIDGAHRMSSDVSGDRDARAPAHARLFLRQVRIEAPTNGAGRIGYSPDATIALPSLYRLPEADKAWDVLEFERAGKRLSIIEHQRPEPTSTRIRLRATSRAPTMSSLVKLARRCADAGESSGSGQPTTGTFVAAALCQGARPQAVLVLEAHEGALLLTAKVWRRGRLEPHHIELEPESLVQMGAASAAVPGVTMWELPAPRGRSELFAAPSDLLGPCATLASSVYAGDVKTDHTAGDTAVCVIPFAAPFALEVRRLRPDVSGVTARATWATALLILPLLGWLLILLLRRRSETTGGDASDLVRFSIVSLAAVAILTTRLLWAHRIDMMRDWVVVGTRTESNVILVAAVAAALALVATLSAMRERPHARLIAFGVFVFAAFAAWLTAPTELGFPDSRAFAQFAVAGILGSFSLWKPLVTRAFDRTPHRVVLAIAAAALTTSVVAPRAVALKLLLASISIVAGYRVIRSGLSGELRDQGKRLAVATAAAFAMLISLAVLDTGLAMVIAVPGFLVGLALAGHDALFGAEALTQVKGYKLRAAPLLWLQGVLLGGLVVIALVWTTASLFLSDTPTLARDLTLGTPHLLLVICALLGAPAVVAHRRGETRTAMLFGGAALMIFATWLCRNSIAELVLASSAPAAQRYAVIADPGYALLADPRAFLSGITGWAETIFTNVGQAFTGAGFFGAQLIDPGVLLSIENDYLPILVLRELGILGMTLWAVTSLGLFTTSWLAGRELTSIAGPAARGRVAIVCVFALAIVYQPLAALGALPLTGVSWLGLGVDSPSDLWMTLALLGYLLSVASPANTATDSRHERALRSTSRFRRRERWVAAAAGLAAIAGVLLIARASLFATNRPMPVAETGEASKPFIGLEAALDYTRSLRCETNSEGKLEVVGTATDPATTRFHRKLLAHASRSELEVGATLTLGLVTLTVRDAGEALHPSCDLTLERRALKALRVKPNRPYQHARVRLVTVPMGRSAGDHGELVSGDVAVRLRATAAPIKGPLPAGIHAATSVDLGGSVVVKASSSGVVTLELSAEEEPSEHWLFVEGSARPRSGVRSTTERSNWTPVSALGQPVALTRDALIVVGRGGARNVWLYRSPKRNTNNPLDNDEPMVGNLLADDARSVTGARRRLYVYGNDLPELGWVNPFRPRGSIGLDGWVHAALSEWTPDAEVTAPQCGSLAPPAAPLSSVCAAKPDEDLIECRVSVQPELAIRLRHLTEMIAEAPADFSFTNPEERQPKPLRASFMLMRGDTGEIAAQASYVPGRASPAYAPTSAALETHLIRLREDRDPRTGAKLPKSKRGEASAEKSDHDRPAAVGSLLKPMFARAFEQTAPALSRRLVLAGAPTEGAICRGNRHAIFGHCPTTDSLWNQRRALGVDGFLAHSANWFMAGIAMIGTALPAGEIGLGDRQVELGELLTRNVGDHSTEEPLWTKQAGTTVIDKNGRVDVAALRATPMWQRFEAIVGRPLCDGKSKFACKRSAIRRDVCAGRALAVSNPTADLRQLVSLGPAHFDFYPRLKNRERELKRVPMREYLQFLRGSGVHPIGSIAQLTDAFNRVIYEAGRDPLRDGPYQLAATWFPGPVVGEIPQVSCSVDRSSGTAADGLCDVVRHGTAARALRGMLESKRVEIYGAKTGTVDSLGDIAARKKRCDRFRQAHTLANRPRVKDSQPYWLECGPNGEVDDSLLVISFAVLTPSGGRIPLTLGMSFQRAGSGFATRVASHYIDIIANYFGAGERGLP